MVTFVGSGLESSPAQHSCVHGSSGATLQPRIKYVTAAVLLLSYFYILLYVNKGVNLVTEYSSSPTFIDMSGQDWVV